MAETPATVNAIVAQRRAAIMDNLMAAVDAASATVAKGLQALQEGPAITSARDLQSVATTGAICQDKLQALQVGGSYRFGGDDKPSDWAPDLQAGFERIRVRDFEVTRPSPSP